MSWPKKKSTDDLFMEKKLLRRMVCVVCNGRGEVKDAKTKEYRPCVMCLGKGISNYTKV